MMKFSMCALLTGLLLAQTGTAEAKAYKGAEVYTIQSVLYGRMEIRMRMMRGSGLISTFFTYKNGSATSLSAYGDTMPAGDPPTETRRADSLRESVTNVVSKIGINISSTGTAIADRTPREARGSSRTRKKASRCR